MFLARHFSVGTKNNCLLPHLHLTGNNVFVVVVWAKVSDLGQPAFNKRDRQRVRVCSAGRDVVP